MHLKSVSLSNIKGFEDLEFDFSRGTSKELAGWTVITGDNGSGKSAFLKSIAIALSGPDAARSLQPSFAGWRTHGIDEDAHSQVSIDVRRSEEVDFFSSGGQPGSGTFKATIRFSGSGRETFLEAVNFKGKRVTPQRTIWAPKAAGWFCCGYGPFRRVFGASPEAMRQMVAPTTERFVTMFQEAASLAEVDQWLRALKHKELEGRHDDIKKLEVVKAILDDDFLPNGMKIAHINSEGLWLRDRSGATLSWDEMSDGYRAALALVADILRHLINAYGIDNLTGTDEAGKLLIGMPGVVLIDEVDAHLHPVWQQSIGFWLKHRFPNIQFIVTSHSPLVCQAADEGGLFVLPARGGQDFPRKLSGEEHRRIVASRPDTILLTPAFGLRNTRSPVAVTGRARLSQMRAKVRAGARLTEQEKIELSQLELFDVGDEAI
ncbi:AAA family ATPase [Paracoccus sanguinis]|uniref:AAA family ATPase n=1 Tax=Paracoccus sanguinis TaxID=1545044 RepID=UPI0014515E22|nr:AAA family ATPase [Paracoccus sanguinis]QJD17981.1 AAA family ATPase [Paracoccus sanguinis]